MSFAFSRVKFDDSAKEDEDQIYRALRSQISVLAHTDIRNHPNIVTLIGVSWDIRQQEGMNYEQREIRESVDDYSDDNKSRETAPAQQWTVEKTKHGDLPCFMKSRHGKLLDMKRKMRLCTDLAKAIRDMHRNRIVHRDIKPANVLIFERGQGEYVAIMSDLGFSIQLESDSEFVMMPRSSPWDAPEWHHRGQSYPAIVKMDIYSFGAMCLWLLFEQECLSKGISFETSRQEQYRHLQEVKNKDELSSIAIDLVHQCAVLSYDQVQGLTDLFKSCLASNPNTRESNIDRVLQRLSINSAANMGTVCPRDSKLPIITSYQPFSIRSRNLWVRGISFELGDSIPIVLLLQGDLASIWSSEGQWEKAEELLLRVVEARKLALGTEHSKTLSSIADLASTYAYQGRWHEAETVAKETLEKNLRLLGTTHPISLSNMANLASIYADQGRWEKAEKLELQIMRISSRILGIEHPDTPISMDNLASTYRDQGRWDEAKKYQTQVIAMTSKILGAEHPDTLTSRHNLGCTYGRQEVWEEAEDMFEQVAEKRMKVLGEEHPDTLARKGNLALAYSNRGRWKDAEYQQTQVIDTMARTLGNEHPDRLRCMAHLALTYNNQRRWVEAEALLTQVIEALERVSGAQHPETLLGMASLASMYNNQGGAERWGKAEDLLIQVIGLQEKVIGANHPDTLTSMIDLVAIHRNQGR